MDGGWVSDVGWWGRGVRSDLFNPIVPLQPDDMTGRGHLNLSTPLNLSAPLNLSGPQTSPLQPDDMTCQAEAIKGVCHFNMRGQDVGKVSARPGTFVFPMHCIQQLRHPYRKSRLPRFTAEFLTPGHLGIHTCLSPILVFSGSRYIQPVPALAT